MKGRIIDRRWAVGIGIASERGGFQSARVDHNGTQRQHSLRLTRVVLCACVCLLFISFILASRRLPLKSTTIPAAAAAMQTHVPSPSFTPSKEKSFTQSSDEDWLLREQTKHLRNNNNKDIYNDTSSFISSGLGKIATNGDRP